MPLVARHWLAVSEMKTNNRLSQIDLPVSINVSGGKTSAFGAEEVDRLNLSVQTKKIFTNTAAEHNETYDFLRALVRKGHDLICLEGDFNQPLNQGHTAKVVDVNGLKYDPYNGPIGQILRKYGVFTNASAWCTTRMKEDTQRKYLNEIWGKNKYYTFLGIRYDEPARLVGANYVNRSKSCYHLLSNYGYTDQEITEIFKASTLNPESIKGISGPALAIELLERRIKRVIDEKLIYLAEISDYGSDDIADYWSDFDGRLKLSSHLGNCVFCVKKSLPKLALAIRDEPDLAEVWKKTVEDSNPRLKKEGSAEVGSMYRGKTSISNVIAMFQDVPTEALRSRCRSLSKTETGCASSCEAFSLENEE